MAYDKQPKRKPIIRDVTPIPAEGAVFGRNALRELLASGRAVDKIFVQRGEREGSITQLVAIALSKKIPVVEVEKQKLDHLSGGGNHQGVVAMAAQIEYVGIDDILEIAASRNESPFVVILDGVQDPHNIGAIIRSADVFGVHGVIIPKHRAGGITAAVEKTSAGALEHVAVAKVTNISDTIEKLKKSGLWIYAAEVGGTDIEKVEFGHEGIGVVLGSEGDGVSRLVLEKCDFRVTIQNYGHVNSLNVSCAAAVVLSKAAAARHA
ncbi:MAG: 23S rRNA (guanosine(2251)-2'-O)-methyltransferase RlmB [Clostridia bacterium]|nr:23S rRNA (guanosine(2251)-2'-O)-methyltransferase RlmB [Clostridia bacterium]